MPPCGDCHKNGFPGSYDRRAYTISNGEKRVTLKNKAFRAHSQLLNNYSVGKVEARQKAHAGTSIFPVNGNLRLMPSLRLIILLSKTERVLVPFLFWIAVEKEP